MVGPATGNNLESEPSAVAPKVIVANSEEFGGRRRGHAP